jgi:hypothetical protein
MEINNNTGLATPKHGGLLAGGSALRRGRTIFGAGGGLETGRQSRPQWVSDEIEAVKPAGERLDEEESVDDFLNSTGFGFGLASFSEETTRGGRVKGTVAFTPAPNVLHQSFRSPSMPPQVRGRSQTPSFLSPILAAGSTSFSSPSDSSFSTFANVRTGRGSASPNLGSTPLQHNLNASFNNL